MDGWRALAGAPGAVSRHDDVGLAVLRPPSPLHYYSLFSHAIGADTVLTQLPKQRYELESRWAWEGGRRRSWQCAASRAYTGRPGPHALCSLVHPATPPHPPARLSCRYTQFVMLHSRPVQARLDLGPLARALNRVDDGREPGTEWGASSMVDTGPILR